MIPILTYHAVGDGPPPLWISPEAFERQLDALVGEGWSTLSLGEIVDALASGRLPEKRFAITFDDGYANVLENAWPRLRDRGLGATVFVITDRCGGDNRWPGQPSSVPTERLLSWDEVARLAAEGCGIGSHTRTHLVIRSLDASALEDEIGGSREAIERETGASVEAFAWPYGFVSDEAIDVVRDHYRAAVTTELRGVQPTDDPMSLPRIDSCTLGPTLLRSAGTMPFDAYLGFRRVLRSARRLVAKDWS